MLDKSRCRLVRSNMAVAAKSSRIPTNAVNTAVDNLCKSPPRLAFKRAKAGRSVFAQ